MRNLIDIEFDIELAGDLMKAADTIEERVGWFTIRQDLKHEYMVTLYRMKRKDF
jgi:hypothetical protein